MMAAVMDVLMVIIEMIACVMRGVSMRIGVVRLRAMRMHVAWMAETPQKQTDTSEHQHDPHDRSFQTEDAFQSIPESDHDRAQGDGTEDVPHSRTQRYPGCASH